MLRDMHGGGGEEHDAKQDDRGSEQRPAFRLKHRDEDLMPGE